MKSRDITLPTKIHLVKAMVFPVVMYGYEIWTVKKAEHWRIDAFELWWWRKLLRVPWAARRSNQSILKEISPEYSLEGLMLKLKLHYFGHLMQRTDSFEKTLMLGMIEGRRRREWQRMRWLMASLTWVGVTSRSWWWTGKPGVLQSMGSQIVGHDWATELNWSNSPKNFFFKSPLPQLPLCHSILILPCLTFCCLHLFMAASVSTLRTFPGISPLPCSHKALIFIIPSVAEMGTGRIKVLHPFFTG